MRKRICFVFFIIVSTFLFTSFSPSLDGRAVVADASVFPQGYFAKTVGYLPGDSIVVSNLASEKTLEILVVGALDPSEGVAILLSPEAANALGIIKNSNVVVKITKRSGELDEAVSGTAVIASGTIEDSDIQVNENDLVAKAPVENTETDITEKVANQDEVESLLSDDEENYDIPEYDELVSEKIDTEELSNTDVKDEPIVQDVPEEFAETITKEDTEDKNNSIISDKVIVEQIESSPEYAKDESIAEVMPTEENIDVESEQVAKETIEEKFDVAPLEDESVAEVTPTENESNSEAYDAILLPTPEEIAMEEDVATEQEAEIATEAQLLSENELALETKIVEDVPKVDNNIVNKNNVSSADFDKYFFSSMSSLEKGKYYVQIAVFSNNENVRETVNKYESDYPFALVPLSSGKATQVMIGPLSVDEYAAVMAKFKSYGYKDSFLRKVK